MSRTYKFLILALALLMVTLTACSSQAANAASGTKNITASDAGKTIDLNKGDTLVVSLEGNATTGYSWVVADPAPSILQQAGDFEVTPVSDAMGAPGTIVLKFSAVQSGQATLTLEYRRPWEKGVAPDKTYEVTVVVK